MYKISIFFLIIIQMSCGVTTMTTYTDDIYFSSPRVYQNYNYIPSQTPRVYYQYNYNNFIPFNYPYNRQYIYIIPKQNNQPRYYNFNNSKPNQNSTPIRKFPQTKN